MMSSTGKTPNLGLNLWEADDAPLRVDFNADNQRIDAAFEEERDRLGTLSTGLEEANHNIYQLYLRQYYDGKNVPSRATMFFDGFSDNSMMDPASNADRLNVNSEYCLNNWDPRFYTSNAGVRNNAMFLGSTGGTQEHVAQSYLASGPFRILSLSIKKEQSISSTNTVELSLYTANSQGTPQSKQQTLTSYTLEWDWNGGVQTWSYAPATPVVTSAGTFSLCLSSPSLVDASSSQYMCPYVASATLASSALQGAWIRPRGGQWGAYGGDFYDRNHLAFILYGSPVNEPPKWVTKEIVLPRPCTTATVYMTQDAGSVGRILPKLALYNAGETPTPMVMVRDAARDLLLPSGRIETCYTLTRPAGKSRAQLTIQFDGLHVSDKLYEYGCVLGN